MTVYPPTGMKISSINVTYVPSQSVTEANFAKSKFTPFGANPSKEEYNDISLIETWPKLNDQKEEQSVKNSRSVRALRFSLIMLVISLIVMGSYTGLFLLSVANTDFQAYTKSGLLGLILFGFASIIIWVEGVGRELKL